MTTGAAAAGLHRASQGFAWSNRNRNRNRKLVTRYERRGDIHRAVTAFARSLICFNRLQGRF